MGSRNDCSCGGMRSGVRPSGGDIGDYCFLGGGCKDRGNWNRMEDGGWNSRVDGCLEF